MNTTESSTPLTDTIKQIIAECEAKDKQNAAMREGIMCAMDSNTVVLDAPHIYERLKAALQPDAGQRYLSPEQVLPLVTALKALRTSTDDWMNKAVCPEAREAAIEALAHAKSLGFDT